MEIKKDIQITGDMIQTVVTKKDGGILPKKYFDVVGSVAKHDLKKNQNSSHLRI